MTEFSGKTAFITGAASGLGLSMAKAFASRGANVMLADVNADGLSSAVEQVSQLAAVEVDTIVCDVADLQAVQNAAEATVKRFGKMHILVNNAGVAIGGQPGEIPMKDWRWIVDINLMGVVHGVEVFTPLIKSHGEGGHIINTASMAGHGAAPGMAPYNATKYAVVGYSEALEQELAPHHIAVSCLCPAWVRTNIHNTQFDKPSGGVSQADLAGDPAYEAMAKVINDGLDPDKVGQWVADCVEAERLFIFTHPAYTPSIAARVARIARDYQAIIDDGRFGT